MGLPKLERLRLAYFAGIKEQEPPPTGGIVSEPLSQHGAGRDVIKPFRRWPPTSLSCRRAKGGRSMASKTRFRFHSFDKVVTCFRTFSAVNERAPRRQAARDAGN
jgi:hypothetical protein